jgi:ankyrin repeat protein
VCKLLLDHGANPNLIVGDETTALITAAFFNHPDVCAVLIENGADINLCSTNGRTPLTVAAWLGHFSVCEELVKRGADANKAQHSTSDTQQSDNWNGWSALMYSTYHQESDTSDKNHCHLGIAKLLLDNGANINYQTPATSWTALIDAADKGDIDFCVLLRERNADVSLMDSKGLTALDYALIKGNNLVAEIIQADRNELKKLKKIYSEINIEGDAIDDE